jgi:uncharacterized delta-60 repeat protein
MKLLLRTSIFSACCQLSLLAWPLTLLVPAARAQAPTVTVTPAGPLTLCAGSSQTLTAAATIPGFNTGSGFDGYVHAVLAQPDGRILVGGTFTSYNGNAAAPNNLLRLNPDGSLDTTFNAGGSGADFDVDDLALQPDGKVLVGGNFTSYNGNVAAPDRVLRLTANGSLDTSFNAGGSGLDTNVTAVVVQPDGKVLLGGNFTSYNGSSAAPDRVLRLNADGTLDTGFNTGGAGADNYVYALALQPDGKVLVGGFFTTYNGRAAVYLLRLNAAGSAEAGFNAGGTGPDDVVEALALQPDGKVLVGGDFSKYNNAAAPAKLVRLNSSGSLDTSFNAGGSGASGFGFSYVFALALQPDGKLLVGGLFASYNGSAAAPDCVLRLNANGTLDPGFNAGGAGANDYVYALSLQPDGQVLVGGRLTSYNGNVAAPDNLLRLNPDGNINTPLSLTGARYAWSNGATGSSISVSQPGFYQVTATTASGTAYSNVVIVNAPPPVKVQLTPAGPLVLPFGGSQTLTATATMPGFNVGGNGLDNSVNKVLVQPDGKILVGGLFTSYNGNAAAPDNLLRLNADGSLDASFNSGGTGLGGTVSTLALQPDGKILVSGFLRTYNGNAAAPDMLLRLNSDGSLDPSFNPGGTGFDNGVRAIAVQADGRILAGGGFVSYNGSAAAPDYLLRLNPDGSLDTGFNKGQASTNSNVFDLAVQPDGKVLVAGIFTGYNGSLAAPDYVLRLLADGSLDTSFNSGGTGLGGDGRPNNTYGSTLALQADGRILLGGVFISYNGNAAAPDHLLRLNADGSLDTSFNNGGVGFNEGVFSLAAQPDGKVLVGGYFTGYNSTSAAPPHVLRLLADGTLDTGFNAGGSGTEAYVNSVALQVDGRVLAAGWFASYNGNAAAPDNLVRLTANGRLDNLDQALPGATFVFNPWASTGSTYAVSMAGSYTVTATDPATGCHYESNAVVVTVQPPLATVPAALIQQVKLYPNPSRTSTFLELPTSLGRQVVTATLLDGVGRAVRTVNLPAQGSTAHQLDLRGLSPSIYALYLRTSAGTVVKKLLVE